MEQLPIYISAAFILTTFLTLLFFLKASHYSRLVITIILCWLILQMAIGLSGFYTITSGIPPRIALLIGPPIFLIIGLLLTKAGRTFIDGLSIRTLTLLHVVRIPVEVILLMLFLHKLVPQEMTFEGRNFDILCGLTAPFIYYFGFIKQSLGRNVILVWSIICLLLLLNIVATAILSAPFAFQRFGFNQPNVALLYFPFIWLPGFIVPVVLFSHLVSITRLITDRNIASI